MDGSFLNVLQMNTPAASATSSALPADPLRPLTPIPNKPPIPHSKWLPSLHAQGPPRTVMGQTLWPFAMVVTAWMLKPKFIQPQHSFQACVSLCMSYNVFQNDNDLLLLKFKIAHSCPVECAVFYNINTWILWLDGLWYMHLNMSVHSTKCPFWFS